VQTIVSAMRRKGYSVDGISSDLDQKERENLLAQFRTKKLRIVIATDVLSRGIDIKDINLVVNYDVPNEAADYVHRIGRTARANTKGNAITLVNEDDMYKFSRIEKLIERELPKLAPPADMGEPPVWNTQYRKKPMNNRGGNNRGNFRR
jgi:superfamily II DNA/RNA helicase